MTRGMHIGIHTAALLGLVTFLAATPALAAANLRVTIPAPPPTHVYDAINYNVVISNNGNQTASAVVLKIDLPPTHTSPQIKVMGTLAAVDSRCTLAGTRLTCALGSITKNNSKTVTFSIALPEAAETLSIATSVVTSSSENSYADNAAASTPTLLHYAVAVADESLADVRHCTGQNLTSFLECVLSPSSISAHTTVFHADGTLGIPGEPDYGGEWSQPTPDSLELVYTYGDEVVAEFSGHGTDTDCFEGITTFPDSPYVSPYEICF